MAETLVNMTTGIVINEVLYNPVVPTVVMSGLSCITKQMKILMFRDGCSRRLLSVPGATIPDGTIIPADGYYL